MKTINQFLLENNCPKLELLQFKGRAFAKVADKDLVVSKSCEYTKPLFVTPLSTFNNGVDDTDGSTIVPNAFVLCNSGATIVHTISVS
jgi:hypothetical protein